MTLDRRTVNLQLVGGLSEHADPHVAVSPIVLQNCRYRKAGSIAKRWGSSSIGRFNLRFNASVAPSSSPPAPQLLTTRVDELVRVGSGELDTVVGYSSTTDAVFRDRVPECVVRRTARVGDAFFVGESDVATVNGRTIVVSGYVVVTDTTPTYAVYVDILDKASKAAVVPRWGVDSGTAISATVKVVVVGTKAYVYWVTGTALKQRGLNLTTNTWDSPTTIGSSVSSGTSAFDVATDGQRIFIIAKTAAGTGVHLNIWDTTADGVNSAFAGTEKDLGGYTAIQAVAVEATSGERVYFGFLDFDGTTVTAYGTRQDPNITAFIPSNFYYDTSSGPWGVKAYSAPLMTKAQLGIVRTSSTTRTFCFSDNDTRTLWWNKRNSTGTSQFTSPPSTRFLGNGTTGTNCNPTYLAGKPFAVNGRFYAPVQVFPYVQQDATVASYALVDLYAGDTDNGTVVVNGRVVAHFAPQQAYSIANGTGVPRVMSFGSSVYALQTMLRGAGTSTSNVQTTLEISECDFAFIPAGGAQVNGTMILPGGVPHSYDGIKAVECGFLEAPYLANSSQGAGGSLTALAAYTYCVIYEWPDAAGNIARSERSANVTVTLTGANQTITMTATCANETNRKKTITDYEVGPVQVSLFRTLANQTTLHLVAQKTSTISSNVVIFPDTASDTSISTNRVLYTTGGILASQAPPSCGFTFRAGDRVFLTDTDDGRAWYSTLAKLGEAPQFHSTRTIEAPQGARYTCGAGMDQNIVLFTPDAIDVFYGDGPNTLGVGSFSQRFRVPSDVGCTVGASIVSTPYGIFFMSRDGFCLLTRSLQVRRIGKSVEDSTGVAAMSPYTVRAAVNVPDQSEVRFPLSVTNKQRAVVFDIEQADDPQNPDSIREIWSVDEWTCPIGGTPEVASGVYWNGKYTWITTTGYVFQDDYTTHLDTSTGSTSAWVTESWQTSHWNSQGLGSWMSVFSAGILGDYATDHDVTIEIYQDWATSNPVSRAWTRSELAAVRTGSREQLLVLLPDQKCQAVSVKYTDATPTGGTIGTGEGAKFSGVMLELGPRVGMVSLPSGARK